MTGTRSATINKRRATSAVMTNLTESLDEYFGSADTAKIVALREAYLLQNFAEIPNFLPEETFLLAKHELESVFDNYARRRDLVIKQSGNTPRKYSNVDRDSLAKGSTIIPAVFQSLGLRSFLQQIVGETVFPVPYVPEEYIAARLHRAGDVHGWHWDDYAYALVWIFESPNEENGGSLEYIQRVSWDRDDPKIEELVAAGPVLTRHPPVGSAYLLKADTSLHRVSPLRYDDERVIVCYTFCNEADLGRDVDHESMEALYPESDAHHGHHGL
ncbi:MAG: HalD/BesD family halogenase [Acidimicrobiales bacterium]